MAPLLTIPDAFTAKKSAILKSLSTPDSSYTDLSPKGTVDEAIKDLIDRINTLEGVVTTSSCSGRVSVFLEGRKHHISRSSENHDAENRISRGGQAPVPGGKGMGGQWLLISHEHVSESHGDPCGILGLEPMQGLPGDIDEKDPSQLRFARFQFEPMVRDLRTGDNILHIMTASLHHAQLILAAAINAGFRESGVQSLKNLDDVNCFPMVAIRSAGLALESVVGVCLEDAIGAENDREKQETACSMVSDQYCRMLLKLANERFKINSERMRRFEYGLFTRPTGTAPDWEDGEARKARKRAEGLEKREALRRQEIDHRMPDIDDQENGIF